LARVEWRVALRALAGFLAGLAIWILLSPLYDRVIATGAEKVIRLVDRSAVTTLKVQDDGYVTVNRTDFDPQSKRPGIPIRDLTFNLALLTALFAVSRRIFSDRNIAGFFMALVILAVTHVFGAVIEVMSIYALKLGMWSRVHFTDFERNIWGVLNHFYRLVLMYAVAFALWWIFGDSAAAEADAAPVPAPKKRKRR
jgi:hypothetical protein